MFERLRRVDATIERDRLGWALASAWRSGLRTDTGCFSVANADLGEGTGFTVYLPAQAFEQTGVAAHAPSSDPDLDPGQALGLRVLVVDDNRDSADTLALLLGMLGHDVTRCYNPHEVEALANAMQPDLVLLDLGMPGLSGYDVARQLRMSASGTALRLVAMTGWGQPEDFRRTSEAGFDAHLVKPVDAEVLLGLIATWSQPGD